MFVSKKFYSTINNNESPNDPQNTNTNTNNNSYWCISRDQYVQLERMMLVAVTFMIFIIGGIVALYLLGIILGIILVGYNNTFETVIVYLFGRATYNKNFPVCSTTTYGANDCYTTTSIYCS